MGSGGRFDRIAEIQAEERDYNMQMRLPDWGASLGDDRWILEGSPARHFVREISVPGETEEPAILEEKILPFPSAPIYGINRKAEYDKALPDRPNMHSVRLLMRPQSKAVHRLFILHNGLNETDSLRFYYQLANWILRQQEEVAPDEVAACLIMPFPGHLMHASFHGPFSETPLSRYLNDAGDLYRQFLRYMVGVRWLLSIVSDSDAEDWMVGGDLLDPSDRISGILGEIEMLHDMSDKRIARTEKMMRQGSERQRVGLFDLGDRTSKAQVQGAVELLRSALGRDRADAPASLRIHVVGYSLGGFVAQSVFFAWPQVVSSCTTICSGGAISALAPTAFAHPEEWQSVLHALRPETANAMLQGRLADDELMYTKGVSPVTAVAGIPLNRYGYFQRIFEQVFLQEDKGSYKERLSEYGLRMLFVSGGEDPIVPPANILDASPKEGTTMLSIAGMTHFLNQDPKDDGDRRESKQRKFWLPEAGGMIARSAIHAERVHMEEREQAAAYKRRRTRPPHWLRDMSRESTSSLADGYTFEAALDWVFEAVSKDEGWLLVSRNAIPAAFLPPNVFTKWGTGLHHHDLRVQRYALGLRHRRRILREISDRTTLIIPEKLRHWFVDVSARFEPHSDAPGGRVTDEPERRRIWREFEKDWWECTRQFQAGAIREPMDDNVSEGTFFADAMGKWIGAADQYLDVTHLPDVWIGIHPDSRLLAIRSYQRAQAHREFVEGTARAIRDIVRVRDGSLKKNENPVAKKKLEDDLADGLIRVVQISGAEFNPRYRGTMEKRTTPAARLLARGAAGLVRSTQNQDPRIVGRATAG
jgi:pimeloyl-ACP methyl ester carboxylesterase